MFQMLFILQSLGVHLLGAETMEPEEENSVAAWNFGGSPHWHHAGSRHCCTCNDHRHSCVGGPQGKRTISLKGAWACLMSPPYLERQGCHLIPLYYLLSCSSAESSVSSFFFSLPSGPFSWLFFQKILQYFLFRDRHFCTALVYELGEVSWSRLKVTVIHMTGCSQPRCISISPRTF